MGRRARGGVPFARPGRPTGLSTAIPPQIATSFTGMCKSLPIAAALLFVAGTAGAVDLLPHQAEYRISLGTAVNATQVGTARHGLTETCRAWRLERAIEVSISITTTWSFNVASALQASEARDGGRLEYTLSRLYNGERSQRSGTVLPSPANIGRAELLGPAGPQRLSLPAQTFLPASGLRHMIGALRAGQTEFSFRLWDSEIISDVFAVSVTLLGPDSIGKPKLVGLADGLTGETAWPLHLAFRRGRDGQAQAPLFALTMLLHDTGVISRMTVPLGFVTLAIEPVSIKPVPRIRC